MKSSLFFAGNQACLLERTMASFIYRPSGRHWAVYLPVCKSVVLDWWRKWAKWWPSLIPCIANIPSSVYGPIRRRGMILLFAGTGRCGHGAGNTEWNGSSRWAIPWFGDYLPSGRDRSPRKGPVGGWPFSPYPISFALRKIQIFFPIRWTGKNCWFIFPDFPVRFPIACKRSTNDLPGIH